MTAHPPPRHPPATTNYLYAWIGRDPDGVEGILSAELDGQLLPLVATNRRLAVALSDLAQRTAAARKHPVHLVQFLRGETLRTERP